MSGTTSPHWQQFLRILAATKTGALITSNTLRDDIFEGAQIPASAMGSLWRAAAEAGYIKETGRVRRSANERSRGSVVREWRRTRKRIPDEALGEVA